MAKIAIVSFSITKLKIQPFTKIDEEPHSSEYTVPQ